MIYIRNLKKVFTLKNDSIKAVDSVTLDIEKGEIFGVIGYSGAGKSTFIRLLNRLEEPTAGEILINDERITSLSRESLRKARQEIGMIFQHFNLLWSRTAAENIEFPLEIAGVPKDKRKERVQELINLVGLSGRENAYPAQLSGGQKQRVGIARALANNPKVLLCDEPTSALDPDTTNSILELLLDINEKLGITIVLITHEMSVIRKVCDRVAVMDDGEVVEVGETFDVFTTPQHETTKKFVEQITTDEASKGSLSFILEKVDDQGELLQLHFIGEATHQFLISDVAKKFPVQINILHGKITHTQTGVLGKLIIHMTGEPKDIEQAKQFIIDASVDIEVIQRAD